MIRLPIVFYITDATLVATKTIEKGGNLRTGRLLDTVFHPEIVTRWWTRIIRLMTSVLVPSVAKTASNQIRPEL